ncbi:D-alanyl-D-alanine carboxypeptidase family protein [Krasilnikovia sp. MM14-A1004]|uniref:D-alanyl-D-alanine carboxypeptidase family protein n=1 Tax=Krasilnikovia sp. MM14-A1004 TaxID=3373541 RepID=UPI00399C7343
MTRALRPLWRGVVAVVAAALVTPLGAATPATAAPAHEAQSTTTATRRAQIAANRAHQARTAAAPVPCPRPAVKPPPGRPPRPVPPKDDPEQRSVGGPALATDGLVVPPGSPKPPALTATSWLVADLDTGEVLGGCGPHVYGTPASVQKLLLAATVMPKLDPKRTVTITDGDLAIEPGSSAVGLVRGGKYSVSTLWLGLLLNSGNDAANTLARLGGGTGGVAATVAAMNAEAQRLGADQTHAVTPSGLDGPGQFTSAYDLALIARVCFDRPDFRRYALTRSAQMPAQKALKKGGFQFQNENKLIYNYPGALGGKTGFTQLARHSYVGGAQRGGRRLVATLLGAEASPLRGWQQGAALLDWGFRVPRGTSVGQLVGPRDGTDTVKDAPAPQAGSRQQVPVTRAAMPGGVSVGAAAAVAVVLAGTPLLLLLTQRRRRVRRRRTRRSPAFPIN